MTTPPIMLYDRRGGEIENRHAAHAVVMNTDEEVIESWGDIDQMICPRSSIKLIQALPLVESGAFEQFNLSDADLVLACASHNGEDTHVTPVIDWINRLGLEESNLECGGHWPSHQSTAHDLVRAKGGFTQYHNNCSGKHAGMITVCKHMGWPITGYVSPDHPLQQMIKQTLSDLSDTPMNQIKTVIDGCSAPNYFLPLKNIARAFARFLSGHGLSDSRAAAAQKIITAIQKHPYLIGGQDRFCTELAQSSKGRVIGKIGAMGNYIVLAPQDNMVIYAKIETGSRESVETLIATMLKRFGLWDSSMQDSLHKYKDPVIKNCLEVEIGDRRVIFPDKHE